MEHILETYGSKIASVIHLAAYYSFDNQDKEPYQNITVDGTKRLLKALHSFEVEQFIFSSTLLVYKSCRVGKRIHETSKLDPKWEYPKSKVAAEKVIAKECAHTPFCILRITGIYDDTCHSLPLAQHIKRIYENHFQKHFFPGNTDSGALYLHVDDLLIAIEKIVEKRKTLPPKLYTLLGEENTYSFQDLQDQLGTLIHGKKMATVRIPKWIAIIGSWIENQIPFLPDPFIKPWMVSICDDHYELDTTYTKQVLDWKPKHDLLQSLPKMVDALKRSPKSWYKEHFKK